MAEQLLAQIAQEYGFSVMQVADNSPAGLRLAQVSGLPFAPGIYIDWELISYGRPSAGKLRREFERHYGPPVSREL